jgi:hypothetical protein
MHYLFLNYETLPGYLSATVKVRGKVVVVHADLPPW